MASWTKSAWLRFEMAAWSVVTLAQLGRATRTLTPVTVPMYVGMCRSMCPRLKKVDGRLIAAGYNKKTPTDWVREIWDFLDFWGKYAPRPWVVGSSYNPEPRDAFWAWQHHARTGYWFPRRALGWLRPTKFNPTKRRRALAISMMAEFGEAPSVSLSLQQMRVALGVGDLFIQLFGWGVVDDVDHLMRAGEIWRQGSPEMFRAYGHRVGWILFRLGDVRALQELFERGVFITHRMFFGGLAASAMRNEHKYRGDPMWADESSVRHGLEEAMLRRTQLGSQIADRYVLSCENVKITRKLVDSLHHKTYVREVIHSAFSIGKPHRWGKIIEWSKGQEEHLVVDGVVEALIQNPQDPVHRILDIARETRRKRLPRGLEMGAEDIEWSSFEDHSAAAPVEDSIDEPIEFCREDPSSRCAMVEDAGELPTAPVEGFQGFHPGGGTRTEMRAPVWLSIERIGDDEGGEMEACQCALGHGVHLRARQALRYDRGKRLVVTRWEWEGRMDAKQLESMTNGLRYFHAEVSLTRGAYKNVVVPTNGLPPLEIAAGPLEPTKDESPIGRFRWLDV